jgi:hypothetical protein
MILKLKFKFEKETPGTVRFMRLLTPSPRPSARVFILAFISGWVDTRGN